MIVLSTKNRISLSFTSSPFKVNSTSHHNRVMANLTLSKAQIKQIFLYPSAFRPENTRQWKYNLNSLLSSCSSYLCLQYTLRKYSYVHIFKDKRRKTKYQTRDISKYVSTIIYLKIKNIWLFARVTIHTLPFYHICVPVVLWLWLRLWCKCVYHHIHIIYNQDTHDMVWQKKSRSDLNNQEENDTNYSTQCQP